MPDLNRLVAGLRCREVLAHLADYVDGELPSETMERIEAHIRGCDQCEKFGGEYSQLVAALRSHMQTAVDLPDVGRRLERRMNRVWSLESE
jgi:anti-sigma factor RsiW